MRNAINWMLERLVPKEYHGHARQFAKFCTIGLLSFCIDFFVLNSLSFFTKKYVGMPIVLFNLISFAVAISISFRLNRKWTFRDTSTAAHKTFVRFMSVYIVGTFINTGIVYLLTTHTIPPLNLNPQSWLATAKILALPFSTAWNFLGARLFVFKKTHEN